MDQKKYRYVVDVTYFNLTTEINLSELKATKSPKEIIEIVSNAVQKYYAKNIGFIQENVS